MKNKALKEGIFQGFVFNIIIFIGLLFIGLNYLYPEYSIIEGKKVELDGIQKKYETLKSKGLSYVDFRSLHKSLGKEKDLDKNIFLTNVLEEFTKEDYEINFINKKGGSYEDFLSIKRREVVIEKNKLDDSGVSNDIKNILPYYTDDSSLSDNSLTDFKFINYIEELLNNFRLEYSNSLGIGNLSIEESIESNTDKSKLKENQLEGKIYNFRLSLGLIGRKKNIIDFIHYIENVGNIKIGDTGEVEISEVNLGTNYINNDGEKIKNNFNNIGRYFLGKKDIYNNLIVDIDSIEFNNYLDSSNLPTKYSQNQTFIGFIKKDNNQVDEKYEVKLVLKFYVKGLPIWRIKKYIKDIFNQHKTLKGFISLGIKDGESDKSKLKYLQRSSLTKLKEYNFYLNSITKKIKDLDNSKKLEKEMGNIYKNAQQYSEIFNKVEKGLNIHLKRVSDKNYKNYITYINKKKEGADTKKP